MRKTLSKGLAVLGLGLGISTMALAPKMAHAEEDKTIYPGVYIDNIDVSGMTEAQAEVAISDYITRMNNAKITLRVGEQECQAALTEFGFSAKVTDAAKEAVAYGRRGNILTRYKEIQDIKTTKAVIKVDKSLDNGLFEAYVNEQTADWVQHAQSASMTMTDGNLTVIPEVVGQTIDTSATLNTVLEYMETQWDGSDIQMDMTVIEEQPQYTTADFAYVKDLLGEFSTHYSGDVARNNNVINGANKLNDKVVYPGDEFSVMDQFVPFTTENGWNYAGAYLNGEVISDIGGGICQVSTTLYNALLLGEIEITERHPHSMSVGYVQLSADAALTEGLKDLKFRNSTDAPIYIHSYASGGTLYFGLYGHETRDPSRTIEYKNEVLETYAPGEPIETVDETREPGSREVKQSAHTGYYAKLWKYVYQNGTLVDTILVNTSKYQSSPERVIVGPPAPEAPPEPPAPEPGSEEPTTGEPTTEQPTTAEPGTPEPETPASEQMRRK